MSAINEGKTQVLLDISRDWKKWIYMIRITASIGKVDVWKYVNPLKDTAEPLSTELQRPKPNDFGLDIDKELKKEDINNKGYK